VALVADVLEECQMRAARERLLSAWGRVDMLVNAAGGHVPAARTDHAPAFAMPLPAFDAVVRLNLHGTVYPTLLFGEAMARQKKGAVVNVSSMAATQAVSGVLGYSVAKAAIENFTRWMAVDQRAAAAGPARQRHRPGFFVATEQRRLLHRTVRSRIALRRYLRVRPWAASAIGGPAGTGAVVVQRRGRLRHRGGDPGRRRIQRGQRHLRRRTCPPISPT
jgi:NAD(P)-dependent dehydrogenase (short-subunit alcohol dehydrogenase family)